MKTLLDEILESGNDIACDCVECQHKRNISPFAATAEFVLNKELTSIQIDSAVEYNRKYASIIGWINHFDSIVEDLLKLYYSPDEWAFAEAIAKWQSQNGFSGEDIDGKIGNGTWRKMKTLLGLSASNFRGALKLINTSMPPGNSYAISNPVRSYGILETIKALEWISKEWNKFYPNIQMRIGDISQRGGGRISPHSSHRIGLDADVSLVVRNTGERIGNDKRKNSSSPLVKDYSKYRHIAKSFVDLILSNNILKVKAIWYFDYTLNSIIPNSQTSRDHYRHFHIRFCMPQKYKSELDLNAVYRSGEKKAAYNC